MALRKPRSAQEPITHPKVLAVEGNDAVRFFRALLYDLALQNTIEIRDFGGVAELPLYLRTLVATPGFDTVTSLAIVRDAETNPSGAFQSICGALEKARLAVPGNPAVPIEGPPRVSAFVLPDCGSPGMLESLCLRALEGDPAFACLDPFFECFVRGGGQKPHNMAKARLHAVLATRPIPDLQLGEAAAKGYLHFDHPVYQQIKDFLCAI